MKIKTTIEQRQMAFPLLRSWIGRVRVRIPTRRRSGEVLKKFGIQLPKPTPRIPRTVEIGAWHLNAQVIRLDRASLFEKVWTEPVWKLARGWGLSDRGLAKACGRLLIPLPPRGTGRRFRPVVAYEDLSCQISRARAKRS
jgi:hypothetical protein